jgi:hypothetical protein
MLNNLPKPAYWELLKKSPPQKIYCHIRTLIAIPNTISWPTHLHKHTHNTSRGQAGPHTGHHHGVHAGTSRGLGPSQTPLNMLGGETKFASRKHWGTFTGSVGLFFSHFSPKKFLGVVLGFSWRCSSNFLF